MKKVLLVLVLAVALTLMLSAAAYAEHAPSNYSQWNTAYGTNAAVPSPHAGYSATTVKCSVCHSIHRSAVMGQNIRNQVGGDWIMSSTTAPTEMMMRSGVVESCDYCHIVTAAGGVRLYNGNPLNRTASPFASGYGHTESNACTYCHAVHGAYTFKGGVDTAGPKIIKYTATQHTRNEYYDIPDGLAWGVNPNVPGNVANHTFNNPESGEAIVVGIEDEIFTDGSVDTSPLVDPLNHAQVDGLQNLINGNAAALINDAVGASMKDVQVGAFCTTCHQNMYSFDSFAVQNPDQDSGLWGGTYGYWTPVAGFETQSGTWKTKGHPVKDATNDFFAHGMTIATGKTVAWSDADTCRKCHDAGTDDAPPGVVYSSWPHVTPGYYRFLGAGSSAAEYAAAGSVQADMVDDATGWLEAGDQVLAGNPDGSPPGDATEDAAGGYMLYPGQNYKSDDPANPQTSSHIGTDGLCLKCHVQAAAPSLGVGRSF